MSLILICKALDESGQTMSGVLVHMLATKKAGCFLFVHHFVVADVLQQEGIANPIRCIARYVYPTGANVT